MPPSASPLGIPNLKPCSLRTDGEARICAPTWSQSKQTKKKPLNQKCSLKWSQAIVPDRGKGKSAQKECTLKIGRINVKWELTIKGHQRHTVTHDKA